MIWPPAASAPEPAARAASDVRVGCPGDLLGGLGVDRWGECFVDPGQVHGKGQRQSKLREERAGRGEEGRGATPLPLQSLGFFPVGGYHDLIPTVCQSACSGLFISHISMSFYTHCNPVRSILLVSTSYSQGQPRDLHKVTR